MDEKITKLIIDYWRKNGVDTSEAFFSLFGMPIDDDDIYGLVVEFYGGVEQILIKLNKLVDKKFTVEDSGYTYDAIIRKFSVSDEGFVCEVDVDGTGEVELFALDKTMSISQAVNDEEIGWEIRMELKDGFRDWLYKNISKITGIVVNVDEIHVIGDGL